VEWLQKWSNRSRVELFSACELAFATISFTIFMDGRSSSGWQPGSLWQELPGSHFPVLKAGDWVAF
jgi:hypothetical protein